jgi:hypothetical protein
MNFESAPQKRTSGLSKVLKASPEKVEDIQACFEKVFNYHLISEYEIKKTPEQERIIASILDKLPEFTERYGGTPLSIVPSHIHILDWNRLPDEIKPEFENSNAKYILDGQKIFIIDNNTDHPSNLSFAAIVVHELMHFNSYQSVEYTGEKSLHLRRVGLGTAVKSEDEEYFIQYNEAVTEELKIRFMKQYFSEIPELQKEIEERDNITEKLKPENKYLADDLLWIKKEEGGPIFHWNVYKKYRESFNNTIRMIMEKNPEKFSNTEEVFNIFARAYFTGHILEIARLIESTFGKGSFRIMGEKTKGNPVIKNDEVS